MFQFNLFCLGRRLLLALLLLSGGRAALGQPQFFPPTVSDVVPAYGAPHNRVEHTGTDASSDVQLQVMTWDNNWGQVWFSWASILGGAITPNNGLQVDAPFNPGTATLSDPDIIVGHLPGSSTIYVNLVYLAEDKTTTPAIKPQTYWDVYYFDPGIGTFVQKLGFPKPMGRHTIGSTDLTHFSPNIDVNSSGQVGLVWQESSVEAATITVTSPSFPSGYSYTEPALAFSQCFGYIDTIDGRGTFCPSTTGVSIINPTGSTATPVVFNQSLRPDVAMSEQAGTISFSYLNSYARPGSSPVKGELALVVKQYNFDAGCTLQAIDEYSWVKGVDPQLSYPRIAAEPYKPLDVEVVLARHDNACIDGKGPVQYAEIHNFGKRNGAWRNSYNVVSLPQQGGTSSLPADDPVVSFLPNGRYPDTYVVAWTGTNYPNGSERDVWARTFDDNGPLFPNYSRVNSNSSGNQAVPSIAGRYALAFPSTPTDPVMAYFLADEAAQSVVFKQGYSLPGNGSLLRPAKSDNGGGKYQNIKTRPVRRMPIPTPSLKR